MKNAKIVVGAPTQANAALASKIVSAQKFAAVECANQRKPKAKKAAAAVGDAVMGAAVESGKKAAVKVENYSAEVTTKLLAAWAKMAKANDEQIKASVAVLAAEFGKTARSIVAKLAREKVYTKATYTTKTGDAPVSKEEIVGIIAAFCGVSADKLESLEKANKAVLQLLQDVLTKSAHDHDNTADQRAADEKQADADNEVFAAA